MLKVIILAVALFSTPSYANSPQSTAIYNHVPNAELVGQGTYSKLFWDIYEAMLFAPDGQYNGQAPYALSITYLSEFKGRDIAERAAAEMKAGGVKDTRKLAGWEKSMSSIFPDVNKGSNLTAVATTKGSTLFLNEGKVIGVIEDKEFAPAFFGIWLKPNTSDKSLRKQLIGELNE